MSTKENYFELNHLYFYNTTIVEFNDNLKIKLFRNTQTYLNEKKMFCFCIKTMNLKKM